MQPAKRIYQVYQEGKLIIEIHVFEMGDGYMTQMVAVDDSLGNAVNTQAPKLGKTIEGTLVECRKWLIQNIGKDFSMSEKSLKVN